MSILAQWEQRGEAVTSNREEYIRAVRAATLFQRSPPKKPCATDVVDACKPGVKEFYRKTACAEALEQSVPDGQQGRSVRAEADVAREDLARLSRIATLHATNSKSG